MENKKMKIDDFITLTRCGTTFRIVDVLNGKEIHLLYSDLEKIFFGAREMMRPIKPTTGSTTSEDASELLFQATKPNRCTECDKYDYGCPECKLRGKVE